MGEQQTKRGWESDEKEWRHTHRDHNQEIAPGDEKSPPSPSFGPYRYVRQFPATGGEADIWLVRKKNQEVILKLYRLGIEPKLHVLEQVREISSHNPGHLIWINEFGFDNETNRWYEILEYVRYGSLKDLIRDEKIPDTSFQVIIHDISEALWALHTSHILHLDLKPSNILVRSLHPLNLILTDFGISTLLDSDISRQITDTKGTPMYWAPEQLGNFVGKEADFWALGVIALEIVTGKHPLEGLNHNLILSTLSSRGIPVPDTLPHHYQVLLKGLLTRNPKKRWGYSEVTRWLNGERTIPVYYEEEQKNHQTGYKGYEFRGQWFFSLEDLLQGFVTDPASWEEAKRHIGRGYLTRWLESNDQYSKAVEVERFLEEYQDGDERLIFLASRYNPDVPFTFLGKVIDLPGLIWYLGRFLRREHDGAEDRILSMLFSGEIERIWREYLRVSGKREETDPVKRIFDWLRVSLRGTSEKKRLYEYAKALSEWIGTGPLMEWNGYTVIRVYELAKRFDELGARVEAGLCQKDLIRAYDAAITAQEPDPELLVACASIMEAMGKNDVRDQCLKKAFPSDARVTSLIFSRKTGINRFRAYTEMKSEYYRLIGEQEPDPWNQSTEFWKSCFYRSFEEWDLPLALASAERVIELDQSGGIGWAMRGSVLSAMRRKQEAAFFFSSGRVRGSDDPAVWVLIAEYEENEGNFGNAEELNGRALERDLSLKRGQYNEIRFLIRKKQYRVASDRCDEILSSEPANGLILTLQADILQLTGHEDESGERYQQVCFKNPDNTDACLKYTRHLLQKRMYSEADTVLTRMMPKNSNNPQIIRLKAYVCIKLGNTKEALDHINKVIRLEPDDPWSIKVKEALLAGQTTGRIMP